MYIDGQPTVGIRTFYRQSNQVVPRFPAGFCSIRVRCARGDANPIPPKFDAVSVFVPEQMNPRYIV